MALPILRTEVLLSALLLFPPVTLKPPVTETPQVEYIQLIQETKKPVPNFDKEVLEPLKAAQKAAEDARIAAEALRAAQEAERLRLLPLPVHQSYVAPTAADGLTGSIGYSRAGGNCILEPGVNNPGYGNPINWPATSGLRIGATVLFFYNHTAVVTGIWSNGDIEIRQQNASGAPHRIPRSQARGYR